ncbi:MAG: AAA family ATPase [Myxococcales bacterium]|nr:AAA family ATPase [Myxococcales bacterium]
MTVAPLEPRLLCRAADVSALAFDSTDDLEPGDQPVGQARAMEAARFALSVARPGYNLAAVGPHGVGKHRTLIDLLDTLARDRPAGYDECYVFNFDDDQRPRHLRLPAGRGRKLVEDMSHLVEDLKAAIPAALDGDEYRARVQEIHEELAERAESVFEAAEKASKEASVKMVRTPAGVAFLPTVNGEVLSGEAFAKLASEEREATTKTIEALQKKLQAGLRQMPRWAKEARDKLRELKREVCGFAVGHSIEELKARYEDLPEVQRYLQAVAKDVVDDPDAFRPSEETPPAVAVLGETDPFRRYRVNLLVDRAEAKAAAVVYEDRPTVDRLMGRIDHHVRLGNLVSDFTLIQPGSLARANGGFLVVDGRKILTHPYSWDVLKRALFSAEIRIESMARMLGLSSNATIEPEAIPLDVKVVLVLDRRIHMLLSVLDSETADLFKVTADFDDSIDRDGAELDFARMVTRLTRVHDLKSFDKSAVARLVEHSAREAGDANKLSTNQRTLGDLLVEADHLAGRRERNVVTAPDVEEAIAQRVRRSERIRARVHELIAERTLMVDTEGERVGQINGLWVQMLGDFTFGAPARITATVRVGRGEVVDIEREATLGGAIHSKGVLILSNYFASRFGQSAPLSLHASLVFEQSYSGVEGDSASLAELCCLLSALSGLPIRQCFAMTGSVDQHGNVQPIGGVNEKVEGFFDVCQRRGLAGQAVIIPKTNMRNLMLRADVIAACREGKFSVYAVERVDEALELLTGVKAGEVNERNEFPPTSVNGLAQARLRKFADAATAFTARTPRKPS